jgi:hypothetical protein
MTVGEEEWQSDVEPTQFQESKMRWAYVVDRAEIQGGTA